MCKRHIHGDLIDNIYNEGNISKMSDFNVFLDEILNLIESVSGGFPSYSLLEFRKRTARSH